MARGGENNILLPKKARGVFSQKQQPKKEKRSQRSVLFASIKKQGSDLYSLKPNSSAFKKAKEISTDLNKGNPLPLILSLRDQEYQRGKSPALDTVFDLIARNRIDKIFKEAQISSSKEAKKEKESLQERSSNKIALDVIAVFRSTTSTEEKIDVLKTYFSGLESNIKATALVGQGPFRNSLLDEVATTPLEDIERDPLLAIASSRSEEDKRVLQEIIERQASDLLRRNIPYNARRTGELNYGVLRMARKGRSLLHLIENRRTLCGKSGAKTYRVNYGDWVDGVRAGRFKKCPKCQKRASEDFLMRVEAERSNLSQDILPLEQQRELKNIAADKKIPALIRKGLREGTESYEIASDLDQYLIPRVVDVLARASDKAVAKKPRGKIFDYGESHILWKAVGNDLQTKLKEEGYPLRNSFYTRSTEDDDPLLELTSPEERKKALTYQLRGNESLDYEKSKKWHAKSEEILRRAIKRSLRRKKSKEEAEITLF